jgi:hypothetical protein
MNNHYPLARNLTLPRRRTLRTLFTLWNSGKWCIFALSESIRQCVLASGSVPQVATAARRCNVYNQIFFRRQLPQPNPNICIARNTSKDQEARRTKSANVSTLLSPHHRSCHSSGSILQEAACLDCDRRLRKHTAPTGVVQASSGG